MAYTAGNLTTLGLAANGFTWYRYDAGDDTFATASTAGYFNNTDDNLSLKVDDWILLNCSDMSAVVQVSSISSGAVTVKTPDNPAVVAAYTTSVATLPNQGVITVAPASAGILYQTVADPVPGQSLEIYNVSATTSATAIVFAATSSVVKFSYGLSTGGATLTLKYQGGVTLRALSTSEYRVSGLSILQASSSITAIIASVLTS